jgi:biopolymer transport protein TolR
MAFDVSSRSGVRSQVNITPLIDVVLVLLIIFMVLTPTTLKHLKPELAKESTAPLPPGPQPVLVELTATAVAVNGQPTAWTALHDVVHGRLQESRQTAVYLKIADDVEYGEAVHLLDVCRGAGAKVLALPSSPG